MSRTLCSLLFASFAVADLLVLSPKDLIDDFKSTHGNIKAKLGNFGFVQMNTNHIGNLVLSTEKNKYGCEAF